MAAEIPSDRNFREDFPPSFVVPSRELVFIPMKTFPSAAPTPLTLAMRSPRPATLERSGRRYWGVRVGGRSDVDVRRERRCVRGGHADAG